jgi:hypothetical protein
MTIGQDIADMQDRVALKEKQGNRTLLEIALDIHMTNTGAMERSYDAQQEDVELVFALLKIWQKPVHSAVFDSLVFALCNEAIREYWVKWQEASKLGEIPLSEQKDVDNDILERQAQADIASHEKCLREQYKDSEEYLSGSMSFEEWRNNSMDISPTHKTHNKAAIAAADLMWKKWMKDGEAQAMPLSFEDWLKMKFGG